MGKFEEPDSNSLEEPGESGQDKSGAKNLPERVDFDHSMSIDEILDVIKKMADEYKQSKAEQNEKKREKKIKNSITIPHYPNPQGNACARVLRRM